MTWNWQKPDWPHFSWDKTRLAKAEEQFLLETGRFLGTAKHLGQEDREQLTVDAMSTEALTTSEIEGEILDRASVQSSIRKQLGLVADEGRLGCSALRSLSEVSAGHAASACMPAQNWATRWASCSIGNASGASCAKAAN